MQPRRANRPGRAAALLAAALLAGCGSLGTRAPPAASNATFTPTVDRETAVAVMLASTLQSMQRLAQSGNAEQAEIMAEAQQAQERAPLSAAQLRYGLLLAVPGTGARDPERARNLLRELAAQPETLAPAERALLLVQLAQLDRELALSAESQRLQAEAARGERDRQTVANRRLQAEIDENAKLRKQLEDAQAKLEALTAQIERNLSDRTGAERSGAAEGRKP